MYRLTVVALLLAFGCSKDTKAQQVDPTAAACAKAKPEGPLAWIEDDYPAALACAKAKKVPVVIDLWAPWCHTCLSMRSTVFTDASFAGDATKFVFVSLDSDRDVNAPLVAKYPLSAWPTFYVVSSKEESVLARFVGSASVAQFHAFLDSGQRALAGGASAADARLLGAERATAFKDLATADEELTAALEAAPRDWVRRPDALTSLILTKGKLADYPGCLTLAEATIGTDAPDDLGNTAAASDFLTTAMMCADERADLEGPRVQALRTRAVARWQRLLDDKVAPLSIDDRSDAMASMRGALDSLGKKSEAMALAEQQRAMLDDAAIKATSPMAAMTYNWHRAEVYVYLDRPLEVVAALEKSAKDLPTEYDPRARLGWVYLKAGKLAEAATWTDDALRLVYGPRKARLLSQRAEIAAKQNDRDAERAFRAEAVKLWETMPAGQASPEALEGAKKALANMDKPEVGSGSDGSGSATGSASATGSGSATGSASTSGSSPSGTNLHDGKTIVGNGGHTLTDSPTVRSSTNGSGSAVHSTGSAAGATQSGSGSAVGSGF